LKAKGVILAAGEGKRMKPVSEVVPKEMIPILGRPFLYYVVQKLADAGVGEAVVVASDWKLPLIRRLDVRSLGVKLEFAVQKEPLGPAHALLQAAPFMDADYMLVNYGDNIAEGNVPGDLIRSSQGDPTADAVVALREVSDTSRYGIARFEGGRVAEIVEKPPVGTEPSRLAAMGLYAMKTESFLESVRGVKFEYGKEQFPPQYILRSGGRVLSWTYSGNWVDMGKPVDMLRASVLISKEPIRCVVLDTDHVGPGGRPSPGRGGEGSAVEGWLAQWLARFLAADRSRTLCAATSHGAPAAERTLASAGLGPCTLVLEKGEDSGDAPGPYAPLLKSYAPRQVLVVGGDYARDLLLPATLGTHVLLAASRDDAAALEGVV
jgi:glucose-1-phosphate thymidylyltransferase